MIEKIIKIRESVPTSNKDKKEVKSLFQKVYQYILCLKEDRNYNKWNKFALPESNRYYGTNIMISHYPIKE